MQNDKHTRVPVSWQMAEQELKPLQDAKCKCHNGRPSGSNGMENENKNRTEPFLTLMDVCGTFMACPVKQDSCRSERICWERTMELMHIYAASCYILPIVCIQKFLNTKRQSNFDHTITLNRSLA